MRGVQLLSLLWAATAAGYAIRAAPAVCRPLSRTVAPVAQFGTGNYDVGKTERNLGNFFSPVSGDAKVAPADAHCRRSSQAHCRRTAARRAARPRRPAACRPSDRRAGLAPYRRTRRKPILAT